jgi:hypothetical protein
VNKRKLIKRLALREYLPWSALLLGWVLVAVALGLDTATQLISATLLAGAARALTQVNTGRLLRRAGEPDPLAQTSPGYAFKVSIAGLAAGLLFIAFAMGLLVAASRTVLAHMLLLLAIGLPARYLLVFAGRPRRRIIRFRLSLALSGLALLGLAIALDLGWQGAALALALREWFAFLVVAVSPVKRTSKAALETPVVGPAATPWERVVEANYVRARRRLATRTSRLLLAPFIGPLAGLVIRTGRSAGADRRLAPHVPQSRPALIGAALVLFAGGAMLLMINRDAWLGLIACSLLRAAASTAAAALWSKLRG